MLLSSGVAFSFSLKLNRMLLSLITREKTGNAATEKRAGRTAKRKNTTPSVGTRKEKQFGSRQFSHAEERKRLVLNGFEANDPITQAEKKQSFHPRSCGDGLSLGGLRDVRRTHHLDHQRFCQFEAFLCVESFSFKGRKRRSDFSQVNFQDQFLDVFVDELRVSLSSEECRQLFCCSFQRFQMIPLFFKFSPSISEFFQ